MNREMKDNQQAEIDQLKQQLEESFTEEDVNGLIEDRDKTIRFLQQQLAEKDKEINSLIADYEKRISREQELMSNLEKQLAEKDKEIERLKIFEKVYYFNQLQASQEDIQQFQQLANQSAVNINHIAITELEKVNGILTDTIIEVTQDEFDLNKLCYLEEMSARFYEKIQQQIKELKGEKK